MRETGVEPARVSPLDPKSSASANSATLVRAAVSIPPGTVFARPQSQKSAGAGKDLARGRRECEVRKFLRLYPADFRRDLGHRLAALPVALEGVQCHREMTVGVPHRGQSSGSTAQMHLISSRHVADATGRKAGVVN